MTFDHGPHIVSALARSVAARLPRAMLWMLLLRVFMRLLAVGTTLAIARLLSPDEYGLYAAMVIAVQASAAFTEPSLSTALIQMARDPASSLATAWTTQIVRGIVVFIAVFALAPAWATFFNVPEAADLLRVLSFFFLIIGFQNVGTALLDRQFEFGRLLILHAAEAITYSVVGVLGALVLQNAWALVIAMLTSFAARTLVSYVVSPVRVRLGFDRKLFGSMFAFSKWSSARSMLDFVVEAADNAAVARLLGATPLAFYRMAFQLATEGAMSLQWVVVTVAFPAFARIQADLGEVRTLVRGQLGISAAVLMPLSGALVALGPDAVALLLGERWAPTGEPLQILAVAALARGVLDTARPILNGLGYSREEFVLRLVQAVLMIPLVVVGGMIGGMAGVALAVLLAALLTLPVWAVALVRYAGVAPRDLVAPLVAPALATVGALLALLATPRPPEALGNIVVQSAVFTLTYLIASRILIPLMPASGFAAARRVVT